MRLGVLGAGHVGATLGKIWAAAGHDVVLGVRDPAARGAAGDRSASPRYETVGAAAAGAELVVLALPWAAVQDVLMQVGAALAGKIVIDATNNVRLPHMHALDAIRTAAPDARLYRAFNSLGWEVFAQPSFDGTQADLLYCGDEDPAATLAVETLISDVGLRSIRIGGLDQADALDGLTRLWLGLTRGRNMGRHLAFKVLYDPPA